MTGDPDDTGGKPLQRGISRRVALVRSAAGMAGLACGFGGCATHAKMVGNTPKMEAQYQDTPSGLERCGVCRHFIPDNACEIVAGPVQANGWCRFYALF